MLMHIYSKALSVLAKKPFKLWGISVLAGIINSVLGILFGLSIGISLCINLLITTSMTMVYLHGVKGEDVKVVHIFDCFKDWTTIKRIICGMAWMYLWLFLYALVPIAIGVAGAAVFVALSGILKVVAFVLAGICSFAGLVAAIVFVAIKSYAYRFTPYILVCEQNVPLTEAFQVSDKRTKGYKGQMFLAEFLISIVLGFAGGILGALSAIPYLGAVFALANVLLIIINIIFVPFLIGLIQAAFYIEIDNIRKNPNNFANNYGFAPQNPAQPNGYSQRPQGNPYGQRPQGNPYGQAPVAPKSPMPTAPSAADFGTQQEDEAQK